MQVNKRAVILLFAVAFVVVAAMASPLIAAYVSAFLGLTVVLGLMGYSAFVWLRNWRLELPGRHREAPKAEEPIERRAA